MNFSIDGLAAEQSGFLRDESFDVLAILTNESSLAAMTPPLFADDVFYSCTASSGGAAGAILGGGGSVDLGPRLTLTGPGTTGYILTSPGQSFYSLSLPTGPPVSSPDQLPPPYFVPGVWQIQVRRAPLPFQAEITTPPTIRVVNYASLQSVNRQKDLVVAWNPAGYGPATSSPSPPAERRSSSVAPMPRTASLPFHPACCRPLLRRRINFFRSV